MHVRVAFVVVALVVLSGDRSALALKAPFYEPQTYHNRTGMVHLFEWKWRDIATECEQFLAPKGFAGVQISPPTENMAITRPNGDRPWYERYQPISYRLVTRSGNETELADMIRRCNAVGVRIFVDLVVNHMTIDSKNAVGTAGTKTNAEEMNYPGLFNTSHFHKPRCDIVNYQDPVNVRNCELEGLHDLDHAQPYVRGKIVDLMNRLIDMGVAGFRIDAAKHMWPQEILMMTEGMKPLNTKFGFAPNSKPFIFQEVIDLGGEAISYKEYTHIGSVIDFKYSLEISRVFRGKDQLRHLKNWGTEWNLAYGPMSVVFVDNHDNQREDNGHGPILNYKTAKQYKMAVAFMLAHPHGFPRVMSSFKFEDRNQGPPMNPDGSLISRKLESNGACVGGHVCEHRWRQIYNMIGFRVAAEVTGVNNWWDNGNNQIAFSRGNLAFVAFNNENSPLDTLIQTGLPAGKYCDVITGAVDKSGRSCTGKMVTVDADGKARITISPKEEDGILAIHVKMTVK